MTPTSKVDLLRQLADELEASGYYLTHSEWSLHASATHAYGVMSGEPLSYQMPRMQLELKVVESNGSPPSMPPLDYTLAAKLYRISHPTFHTIDHGLGQVRFPDGSLWSIQKANVTLSRIKSPQIEVQLVGDWQYTPIMAQMPIMVAEQATRMRQERLRLLSVLNQRSHPTAKDYIRQRKRSAFWSVGPSTPTVESPTKPLDDDPWKGITKTAQEDIHTACGPELDKIASLMGICRHPGEADHMLRFRIKREIAQVASRPLTSRIMGQASQTILGTYGQPTQTYLPLTANAVEAMLMTMSLSDHGKLIRLCNSACVKLYNMPTTTIEAQVRCSDEAVRTFGYAHIHSFIREQLRLSLPVGTVIDSVTILNEKS